MTSLRIAVFEDDARYRATLVTFLKHAPGLECAGSWSHLAEGIAEARRRVLTWDVVLMDLQLADGSGLDGVRAIKGLRPDLPIVVLTTFENPQTVLAAISAGADGYLLKRASVAELNAGIRAAALGGSPLTPAVAAHLLGSLRTAGSGATPTPIDLTDRERDVLRALAQGASYQRAAEALGVSLDTVRTHVRSMYKKLQVNSASQAVARALRDGLV